MVGSWCSVHLGDGAGRWWNAYVECKCGQRRKSWQSSMVTDGWVFDANKGGPQARSTTLTPILVRSDRVLIHDPCTHGKDDRDNSWCQHAGVRVELLRRSNQAKPAAVPPRQCHYFCARRGRRRRPTTSCARPLHLPAPLCCCFTLCGQRTTELLLEHQLAPNSTHRLNHAWLAVPAGAAAQCFTQSKI